jgi:hypothetical protein
MVLLTLTYENQALDDRIRAIARIPRHLHKGLPKGNQEERERGRKVTLLATGRRVSGIKNTREGRKEGGEKGKEEIKVTRRSNIIKV